MYYVKNLKPDRSITGLLPAIFSLFIFFILLILFDFLVAYYFLCAVFLLYSLFTIHTYRKTRNSAFIVVTLFQISAGAMMITAPNAIASGGSSLTQALFVTMLLFGAWVFYLMVNKKLKWRGREILELAAQPVDELADGYTARPHPTGKAEYSRQEILGFSEFLLQNLVAIPYREQNRVVLAPVMMGREFDYLIGMREDYSLETWVSFDFEGQVAVNISKKDYLNYKDDLSFDQLCQSLGDLFVEFLDLYRSGYGTRIIDRLDALGMSPFS